MNKNTLALAAALSATCASADTENEETAFALDDLIPKITNGVTPDDYCKNKTQKILQIAYDNDAPTEVTQNLRYWVDVACIMEAATYLENQKSKVQPN